MSFPGLYSKKRLCVTLRVDDDYPTVDNMSIHYARTAGPCIASQNESELILIFNNSETTFVMIMKIFKHQKANPQELSISKSDGSDWAIGSRNFNIICNLSYVP